MEITVREATRDDALFVVKHLRVDDFREVTSLGLSAKDAVILSFAGSDECSVCCVDGRPALIFGVTASLQDDAASIWALGTNDCDSIPLVMVKWGRDKVKEYLTRYPHLENYCAADYERSIRWLKLLGFTIGRPEPRGINGELFCKLSISKE